jgi:putative endonuclease
VTRNGRNGSSPFRGTSKSDFLSLLLFMYFVYILYSEKCDRYYTGYCADTEKRIDRHNSGYVTATRNCKPYTIKATKAFASEIEARKEETRIKKQKSRKYLEWLIAGNW